MSDSAAEIVIRPMTPADIPRVIEITSMLEHPPHYSEAVWRATLVPHDRPPRLALAACASSGEICGFALAGLFPPQGELELIAVIPACRRRGIARQLLRSLLKRLAAAGVQELWLEVRSSNTPAIAFYRSFGFRPTSHRPGYYSDPVEDGVLMNLQRL